MTNSKINPLSDKMSIVRIAPVCNGKIYVVQRRPDGVKTPRLDLPIEEHLEHFSPNSEKYIRKIKEKYHLHLHTPTTPRFSVQYKSKTHNGSTVYLYILPLKSEDEIHFHEGEFVSSEDIAENATLYSLNLQKEGDLLGMAAELWEDFYA